MKAKFRELFGEEGDAFARRGREYIEKIVQVSFQIPPTNQEQLKTYAEQTLKEIYKGQQIDYFDIVYGIRHGCRQSPQGEAALSRPGNRFRHDGADARPSARAHCGRQSRGIACRWGIPASACRQQAAADPHQGT
jgi:hypothetical protein